MANGAATVHGCVRGLRSHLLLHNTPGIGSHTSRSIQRTWSWWPIERETRDRGILERADRQSRKWERKRESRESERKERAERIEKEKGGERQRERVENRKESREQRKERVEREGQRQ